MKTKTKTLLRLDVIVGFIIMTFIMVAMYGSHSKSMHRAAVVNGVKADILSSNYYTGEIPYTGEVGINSNVNSNNVVEVVSEITDEKQENVTIKALIEKILESIKNKDVNTIKETIQQIINDIQNELEILQRERINNPNEGKSIENKINLLKNLYIKLCLTAIGEYKMNLPTEDSSSRKYMVRKEDQPFKDTNYTEWYTEAVSLAKEFGIVSGYKNSEGKETGEFRPANNVTVGEILKIALETAKKGTSEGIPHLFKFSKHWARGYLKKAEEIGISLVQTDVDLDRPATRAEVVRLILEVLEIQPETVNSTDFSDVSAMHPDASFIQYAKNIGLITGDTNKTTFRPNDKINRAEVVVIIGRLITVLGGKNSLVLTD